MTDQERNEMKRQAFLTKVGIGGVVATGLASMGATVRYLFPTVIYEPSMRTKIGRPSEFAEGTITYLPDCSGFLHRSQGGIHVISATCTHLGCIVAEKESGFTCPCHGSVFDELGGVVSGPAPRGLPWYEVSLSPGGQLVVDRSRAVEPGTKLTV